MLLRGDKLKLSLLDVGIVMSGGILLDVGIVMSWGILGGIWSSLDVDVDLWGLRFCNERLCIASQLRLAPPLDIGLAWLIP